MRLKERSPFCRERWGRFEVRSLTNDEAEVILYDQIGGYWGVSAEDFRRELDALNAHTVHVRINSPGGSVWDGLAIYNALRGHNSRIVTHVDGLAASMASVIALAGDQVLMSEAAFFMIHEPWTVAIGNAAELRKDADLLDKVGGQAADLYRKKTKAAEEQVQEWMREETWFTGAEALEAGFVDGLENVTEEEEDLAAQAADLFDLSIFAHLPAALAHGSETPRGPTRRDLEQALRNAGYSRDAARETAAAVRALQRNAEPVPDEEPDPLLRSVLASLRATNEEKGALING